MGSLYCRQPAYSSCGNKLKYVASITSPIQCRKILDHLKMDQEMIEEATTRGPANGGDNVSRK
jgi:hypothetical protein